VALQATSASSIDLDGNLHRGLWLGVPFVNFFEATLNL